MRLKGIIHSVEVNTKLIGIKQNKRIIFFYFQNSQMNIFKRYLYPGNWIDFEYDENRLIKKSGKDAYTVSFVYNLSSLSKLHKRVYYDKTSLNDSLSKFLKSLGNVMFLDLEMTMPSYNFKGKGFKPEMIQAGFIVLDGEGDEICRYSNYIKPKLVSKLSKRVEDFLGISQEVFDAKAISYSQFYEDFEEVLDNYNPAILVYGKNDIIVVNDSYTINDMPSLKEKTRFINLCQLIKSHYDLRNDPGLFKLYKIYYDNDDVQIHDAFNDSWVTAKVFKAFKDEVNLKTNKAEVLRRELD
ncbi:MAG: hypothetical protein E7176_02525 [Erysipelotrichaceae bacterium]|nr:hypothetical protein [Erysipelotrichaceae bacterium]